MVADVAAGIILASIPYFVFQIGWRVVEDLPNAAYPRRSWFVGWGLIALSVIITLIIFAVASD